MFRFGSHELVVLLYLLGAYFLPFIVAVGLAHPRKLAIFVLNLFAGWTFFGWLGAFVWASHHVNDNPADTSTRLKAYGVKGIPVERLREKL
ncbi:MAG: superinfection immunity protein [Chlorobium sp.]|nr:MAG: superinfection immunity protein [Chlorobium sp.]